MTEQSASELSASELSERCRDYLRERLQGVDSAHDLAHIERVVSQSKRLAEEENARLDIVLPAAWLHDCVIVPKDSPDRSRASTLAARDACIFLRSLGYSEDDIPAVSHAIEAHSFSAGIVPQTLEAQIVQDADRLDALGAIGIARLFVTGGAMGSELHHPTEPFPAQSSSEDREIDDRRYAVDHFYAKLLGLAESFTTPSGRREAERRTQFLHVYLEQLASELA